MSLRFIYQVAGRDCSNTAHFEFYRKNGNLASFRVEERLDHSRFGRDPICPRAEARSAAFDAFQRYHPYPSAVLSYDGILEVGALNTTPRPDMVHEVPSALAEVWTHHVSTPYYIFQFRPVGGSAGGLGDLQNVYVDARNSRPLMIEFGLVLGVSGQPYLPNLATSVELIVGATRGQATRVKGGSASGLPVQVASHDRVFSARYDPERSLLFLPWDRSWLAYRPDPPLAKAMAAAVKRRRQAFGGEIPASSLKAINPRPRDWRVQQRLR